VGLSRTGNRLELWQVEKGIRSVMATVELQESAESTLFLETRFGQYCRFGYLQKDGQPKQVGTLLHVSSLPQWDRPPMTGIQAGAGKGIFAEVKILYRQHILY
jgi:hypothetical protein